MPYHAVLIKNPLKFPDPDLDVDDFQKLISSRFRVHKYNSGKVFGKIRSV